MFACDCLNVIIEPESNDFLKVTSDSLELTEIEKKDYFFNQELQQIQKLHKITKKISGLVATRLVSSRWIVHHCLNCNVHTHAIHRDRGAAFVLVSCKLLNNEAIADIKNSEYFSTVFNIRIMDTNFKESELSHNIIASDLEPVVNSLRQRVNEFLNRETVAVEERIRRFTDEQFKLLDDYRDRAFRDHNILKRKVVENRNMASDHETSTNIDTNLSRNNLTSGSPVRSVPENIASTNSSLVSRNEQNVNNKSPEKKLGSNSSLSNRIRDNALSYDSEMFFPLEDMDDEPTLEQSDFEDSDPEDYSKDENAEPVQRARQATQLARSLPVNIPPFMSAYKNHLDEDKDDDLPDESMDIAASIKALAKSIQGGSVFGELPRPRFSSQI